MNSDYLIIQRILNENGETILTFLFNGLLSIVREIDGLKQGKCYSYFPSKNDGETIISAIYHFEDNILQGNYRIYSYSGIILEDGNYHKGKLHGNQISYRSTTTAAQKHMVRRIVEYKSGIIDGKEIFYYPNGQICSERIYKNGMLNGKSVRYKNNGELSSISQFENNLLVGDYITYGIDGTIDIMKYQIVNNISIGYNNRNDVKFQNFEYEFSIIQWHRFFIYEDIINDDIEMVDFIKDKNSFVSFYTFLKNNDLLFLIFF